MIIKIKTDMCDSKCDEEFINHRRKYFKSKRIGEKGS